MNIRPAAFSGSWYPSSEASCEREIKSFLEDPGIQSISGESLVGGIVPHAGWYYSGSIACNVIRSLADEPDVDVIFIFGMHLHTGSPAYIMAEGAWETPFGPIEIHSGCAEALIERFDFRVETTERFTPDNTIELQLPFVRYFFPGVQIVPIGAPPVAASLEIGRSAVEVSRALGLRAKVIGSTDLTHYGANYGFSPKGTGPAAVDWVKNENDRRIIDFMLEMDVKAVIDEALASQNACCAGAAATAITAAGALGARTARTVAYATSYDKSPGDSLVGYVGIVM